MQDSASIAKIGRPTDYKPEYAEQVEKLCRLGATDIELAEFFDVSVRTIHRWKSEHEAFCHSIKVGKEHADNRVERALYERASGFAYVEQQAIKVKTGQYTEAVEVVDVERQMPPDTPAAIFWLKNRRTDSWRDKLEHQHQNPDGSALSLKVSFVASDGTGSEVS